MLDYDSLEKDYLNDLKQIKDTIRQNQNKAMVVVNSAMIITYYQIGTIINQRKEWGNKYIQKLAFDLKELGKGYSVQNLKYMSQFAKEFTEVEISQQPVGQIPWSTLVTVIIAKSKTHEEMLWYINQTNKSGWSRSMVLKQFEQKAYERNLIEPDTTPIVKSDDSINELYRDTYVFDFLNVDKIKTEQDLKNQMIDNIIKFLQELGPYFSFVGKEYHIITPTNKSFYIDLLMYHTKLHAYIAIEVKLRDFRPTDLGQLAFYVGALDKLEKTEKDDNTIGILICKDADNFVAQTTLENISMKLGISKYKITKELPEYLAKKLKEN